MTREKKTSSTAALHSETSTLDEAVSTSALDDARHTSIGTGSLECTLLFNRELNLIVFHRLVLE